MEENSSPRRERHLHGAGSEDEMARLLPNTLTTCDLPPSPSPDESHARDTPDCETRDPNKGSTPGYHTRPVVAKLPLRTRRPTPQMTTLCASLPLSRPAANHRRDVSTHRNTRPFRARKDRVEW